MLPVSLVYAEPTMTPKPLVPQPPGFNIQLVGNETYIYDSNPLRLINNNTAISGTKTAITAIINDNTPTEQFSLSSEVNKSLFDKGSFDSTDFHEKGSLFTNNERWRVGLTGLFDYDTTRTSEITNFGLNFPSVRHMGWNLSPEVDFKANAVDKYSLLTSMSRSTYNNGNFIDYDYYRIAPQYSHHFDPLNIGSLTLNMERYDATNGAKNTIDTVGPSLGWQTIFTPEITGRFSAGAEQSSQDTATRTNQKQWNYVFSGNLTVKEQQDNFVFLVSRNQQPFGNGGSSLFTTFSVNETHNINERLAVLAGASYRYTDYINTGNGVTLDREVSGSAGLSYGILQNLDITGNYKYTNQTLNNANGTVKENLFTIGLSYHPPAAAL
jgi:hypothetical protein